MSERRIEGNFASPESPQDHQLYARDTPPCLSTTYRYTLAGSGVSGMIRFAPCDPHGVTEAMLLGILVDRLRQRRELTKPAPPALVKAAANVEAALALLSDPKRMSDTLLVCEDPECLFCRRKTTYAEAGAPTV